MKFILPWGLFPWPLRYGVYGVWLLIILHLVDPAVRLRNRR